MLSLKTFEDVRREGIPLFKQFIEEAEAKLRVTRHTVSREKIKQTIMYWQGQIDVAEGRENRYNRRYPNWWKKRPL